MRTQFPKYLGVGVTAGAASFAIGVFTERYNNMKHTPEEVIMQLNAKNQENKKLLEEAKEAQKKAATALDELRRTKIQYQNEVKPGIEAKVREELKEYIDKADATYAKAKEQNEMAALRLELARTKYPYCR